MNEEDVGVLLGRKARSEWLIFTQLISAEKFTMFDYLSANLSRKGQNVCLSLSCSRGFRQSQDFDTGSHSLL